ncbi:MAG: ATP-binding protein [Clostridiales bacterium]|nr:ATP-binding protein [Clostridiales bacterium]
MALSLFSVGADTFEKIRKNNSYFVDKSLFIKEILSVGDEVILITRPRRFGKSTNMSMLSSFFDIKNDNSSLFSGLAIEKEKEVMELWRGKHPVIYISLSSMANASTHKESLGMLSEIISRECTKKSYLLNSLDVSQFTADKIRRLANKEAPKDELILSLNILASALRSHFGQTVIVLIDEYDAPVNHVVQESFRNDLLRDLSTFFGGVFKNNDDVAFSVVAGCLRIANESIFTGANNPGVFTAKNKEFSTSFGLTELEVTQLLQHFGFPEKLDEIRQWYNGYNFAGTYIYNISDVLSYAKALINDPTSAPANYWANTSSNDIIENTFKRPYSRLLMTSLLAGESIPISKIDDNISFKSLKRPNTIWSILFHTGYLTSAEGGQGLYKIPNREIRMLFEESYMDMTLDLAGNERIEALNEAILSLDAKNIEEQFSSFLLLLSSHDTASNLEYVYHSFFAGVLSHLGMSSNREAGYGFFDIQVLFNEMIMLAIIFEFKRFDGKEGDQILEDTAERALRQIYGLKYLHNAEFDGYEVYCYGVGCLGRSCRVTGGRYMK